jgi:S-DNA-T family DNA segregation ATPase FtsK/SpoIIIE
MTAELKRRKKLLSEYSVASLAMYERASGNEEPILFILLDGYEGFKGSKFEEVLEKTITQIAREGAGIGLHLLLSAGRQNALRMNLYSNIKTQIALKLIDDSEARVIVGRTTLTIDDLPGRGLIKLDEPELFQTALPAAGEDTLQIIDAIQGEVQAMDAHWTGPRPEGIPMVPEVLYFEDFKEKQTVKSQNNLYGHLSIGLDFNLAEPISINYVKHNTVLLTGSSEENVEFLSSITKAASLKRETDIYLLDTHQFELVDNKKIVTGYLNEKNDIADLIEEIHEEMLERHEEYLEEIKEKGTIALEKFYSQYDEIILIWNRPLEIYEQLEATTKKLVDEIIESEGKMGISMIFGVQVGDLAKSYTDLAKKLKINNYVIITMRMTDQTIYSPHKRIMNEPVLEKKEAYLYESGEICKIKIIE